MRKCFVMTAIAGALFAASSALPNRADAMAISAPAGMAKAVADIGQVEQARWVCGPFRCFWQPNIYGFYGGGYYGGWGGWGGYGWRGYGWRRRGW